MVEKNERVIDISKVSTKRLTCIPEDVAIKLSIKIGDKLLWIEDLETSKIYVRKT